MLLQSLPRFEIGGWYKVYKTDITVRRQNAAQVQSAYRSTILNILNDGEKTLRYHAGSVHK